MSLTKFFRAIDRSVIGQFVDRKHSEILKTDPDRIYIENVRSFFNIGERFAKFLCEAAVKEKFFKKRIGVICANEDCERIIITLNRKEDAPSKIVCRNCELNEHPNFEFNLDKLTTVTYYQLIR